MSKAESGVCLHCSSDNVDDVHHTFGECESSHKKAQRVIGLSTKPRIMGSVLLGWKVKGVHKVFLPLAI